MSGLLRYLGFVAFWVVMLLAGGLVARQMGLGDDHEGAQGGAVILWVSLLILGAAAPAVRQWWRDRRNRLEATRS